MKTLKLKKRSLQMRQACANTHPYHIYRITMPEEVRVCVKPRGVLNLTNRVLNQN